MNEAFAEVIESSLSTYLAQSWEWNQVPSFGSLVKVTSKEYFILGVVTNIQTGSMDPTRYPFPYRKTEEELMQEHPQIFEFLKTTFNVQTLGYTGQAGNIHHTLPPKPCKIHAFVSTCSNELTTKFFTNPNFLHLLFNANNTNLDELLLAIIKHLQNINALSKEILSNLTETLSLLTGNNYRHLKLLLSRASEIYKPLQSNSINP